jgi:hypothetical protein
MISCHSEGGASMWLDRISCHNEGGTSMWLDELACHSEGGTIRQATHRKCIRGEGKGNTNTRRCNRRQWTYTYIEGCTARSRICAGMCVGAQMCR